MPTWILAWHVINNVSWYAKYCIRATSKRWVRYKFWHTMFKIRPLDENQGLLQLNDHNLGLLCEVTLSYNIKSTIGGLSSSHKYLLWSPSQLTLVDGAKTVSLSANEHHFYHPYWKGFEYFLLAIDKELQCTIVYIILNMHAQLIKVSKFDSAWPKTDLGAWH